MPLAKQCNAPGCKAIVYDGKSRCERHRSPARTHSSYRDKKQEARHKVYASRKWRKLSLMKRTSDPLCEQCESDGYSVPANMVDHIIEIEDNPTLSYEYSNLQSLCQACHNTKTAKVAHARKIGQTGVFYRSYIPIVRARQARAKNI